MLVGGGRFICVFFFFQAEDGIRDYKVTGVQTCALPICCAVAGQRRTMKLGMLIQEVEGVNLP